MMARTMVETVAGTSLETHDAQTLSRVAKDARIALDEAANSAESQFEAFTKSAIADMQSDTGAANMRERTSRNLEQWKALRELLKPGTIVEMKDAAGWKSAALVLSVKHTGKAQNPLALGSWEVRFGIPGDDSLKLSLAGINGEDSIYTVSPRYENYETFLQRVDLAAKESREKRVVLTGNMLAAFNYAAGQIIRYTDSEGNLRQGVMLPNTFKSVSDVTRSKSTPLGETDAVSHLRSTGMLADADTDVTITQTPRGIIVRVPASKREGGR
jgi:hypothetical protein